jgi:hypothetical protein
MNANVFSPETQNQHRPTARRCFGRVGRDTLTRAISADVAGGQVVGLLHMGAVLAKTQRTHPCGCAAGMLMDARRQGYARNPD